LVEIGSVVSEEKIFFKFHPFFLICIIGKSSKFIKNPIIYVKKILTSNQDGHQAKNRKKGDEIKKKSSPLKLLSQSQPNFAEMILGWSPFKIVCSAVGAILIEGPNRWIHFWKRTIQ
jgi:hypothetical protein